MGWLEAFADTCREFKSARVRSSQHMKWTSKKSQRNHEKRTDSVCETSTRQELGNMCRESEQEERFIKY